MNFDSIYGPMGALIGQRRKQLKFTQEQLAPRVGMSRASLANVERGRQKVLVHQLLAIAHALNVRPETLLPPTDRAPVAPADMKLPAGLSPKQRSQIARLMADEPEHDQQEEKNAKPNKG
jgi:transcriptional regulator with XRE-family HTH domain